MNRSELAINGGPSVRTDPLPPRRQFGEAELEMVGEVFRDSWDRGVDFGFQGEYERRYTEAFCRFQGGGFADAVSSGTVALYLALSSLDLPDGSDIIVPPVTDPGGIAPILLLGHHPVLADSSPGSFNIGPDQFESAITPGTKAVIVAHVGGHPCEMEQISSIAKSRGIRIIEDCSQAHGALYRGERIGRFGDIAAFSTMFSKNHSTGGCGGVVYTGSEDLYWRMRSLADRGKDFGSGEYDPKDPSGFLFPALNFNLDELSCAIGISTLSRLQETIDRRLSFVRRLDEALSGSITVTPCQPLPESVPSPFFHTVQVNCDRLNVSKEHFASALAAEGIGINPHYRYLVSQWKWAAPFVKGPFDTPNAEDFQSRSFNILFNENYGSREINDIIEAIRKIESVYAKR